MLLWRLSGQSASIWTIPFLFWAFFHGQSQNFPTKRKIFVFLLQVLVFAWMFHGTVYQAVVTSLMIKQEEPQKLASFDELLESDLQIVVDYEIKKNLETYPKYQKAVEQGRIIPSNEFELNPTSLSLKRAAAVIECEISRIISSTLSSEFYIIESGLFAQFVRVSYIPGSLQKIFCSFLLSFH